MYARRIFEAVTSWSDVHAWVERQQEESLHLDFKQKKSPSQSDLEIEDRKNLAKDLSGFNSVLQLGAATTAYWGDVLGVLIFCFIANGIGNYIFSALLTANNNLKQLAYLYFGGIVLNISLNFSLIPSMNALGAAWAGVITQSTLMIGQIVLAIILLDLKFSLRWLARVGCYISIILFSSVWLTMFSPATFSMTEKGSAIILVSLLSSFILVSPREIIALLRSKDEKTLMH